MRNLKSFLKKIFSNGLDIFAIVFILLLILASIFAPLIVQYSPDDQLFEGLTLQGAPIAPGQEFLLGTDLLGRDLFSRIVYGARTSLLIGVIANSVSVLIGTILGLIAGYFGKFFESLIMRFTDLMMAFPALLLAIALAAILKPSLWIVALVITLVNWVQVCRVIYSQTISLKEKDFVLAAKGYGASNFKIIFNHILPHTYPTMIVWGTLGISTTVLLEATLSFLGIGVQPPTPSWGGIIFESQSYFVDAPWLVFIPGAMIVLLALSFNIIGDSLRDFFDPTQRGKN
ncbi:MAG: ABC transporter permease [Flavobacteriaceae bacterium]|jgi:peptide/nickel transport system permease protein